MDRDIQISNQDKTDVTFFRLSAQRGVELPVKNDESFRQLDVKRRAKNEIQCQAASVNLPTDRSYKGRDADNYADVYSI